MADDEYLEMADVLLGVANVALFYLTRRVLPRHSVITTRLTASPTEDGFDFTCSGGGGGGTEGETTLVSEEPAAPGSYLADKMHEDEEKVQNRTHEEDEEKVFKHVASPDADEDTPSTPPPPHSTTIPARAFRSPRRLAPESMSGSGTPLSDGGGEDEDGEVVVIGPTSPTLPDWVTPHTTLALGSLRTPHSPALQNLRTPHSPAPNSGSWAGAGAGAGRHVPPALALGNVGNINVGNVRTPHTPRTPGPASAALSTGTFSPVSLDSGSVYSTDREAFGAVMAGQSPVAYPQSPLGVPGAGIRSPRSPLPMPRSPLRSAALRANLGIE